MRRVLPGLRFAGKSYLGGQHAGTAFLQWPSLAAQLCPRYLKCLRSHSQVLSADQVAVLEVTPGLKRWFYRNMA